MLYGTGMLCDGYDVHLNCCSLPLGDSHDQLSLGELSEFSSLYLAPSPTPTAAEQTLVEMDQFTEQETRDLLISVLFVLKYLDRGIAQT